MTLSSISLDEIEQTSSLALQRHGADAEIAASVAAAIRHSESRGNVICGLYYLESYCRQLATGRVRGDVAPMVTRPRAGMVCVDAGFGFAQPAFASGLDAAIDAARGNGVATLSISHAHTCTSLGYFTEQIALRGMLAIGFTNASAVVAPPGGNRPVLGTNPIAMSVPHRDGGIAFQFDHSTSAVALGKITMAAAAGESIPLGWAVDDQGNPTSDPAAALKGALVSAGGHKGYSLGLMVEVMASALTGSVSSRTVKGLKSPQGPPHDLGQFYIVIDPVAHGGDAFQERLDALASAIGEQQGARLPGAAARHLDPVQLDAGLWELVLELSGQEARS